MFRKKRKRLRAIWFCKETTEGKTSPETEKKKQRNGERGRVHHRGRKKKSFLLPLKWYRATEIQRGGG